MKKFKFSVEIVGDTHQGGDVWSTAWDGHYFDTIEEAYKVVENLDDRELRDIESDGHLSKDDTTAYVSIIKDVFEEDFIDSEEVAFETLEVLTFHKFANYEWLNPEALAKKMKLVEDLKELLNSSEEEEAPSLLEELDSMDFHPVRLNSDYHRAFEDSAINELLFELAY